MNNPALYFYKARVYSPALGRFLQSDPVGYEDDLNLYLYARNDPLNLSDPTGRNPAFCAVPPMPVVCWAAVVKTTEAIAAVGIGIWALTRPRSDTAAQSRSQAAVVSQARRSGGATFFHGTDSVTTMSIAGGAPLDAAAAAAATRGEQALGFYMTPNPAAANYFAARTNDPGILQIDMTADALEALIGAGGTIGPMQPGGLREPVTEFYLPPTAFGTFNALRPSQITVTPHLPPRSSGGCSGGPLPGSGSGSSSCGGVDIWE